MKHLLKQYTDNGGVVVGFIIDLEKDYTAYFRAFIKAQGLKDGDECKGYEFINWITGKHKEFRKSIGLDKYTPYTKEQEKMFLKFIEGGNSMKAKKLLTQYMDLQAEIKDLEKRIKQLENFKVEHDIVTGSNSEFPYQPRSFKIEGYNIQEVDRLNKLKELLVMRKLKCEEMKLEIEKFISNIPDSRTRRVFQYRYIDGLSWQAIAHRIGKHDESYPRKVIHDKYLEGLGDGINE